MTNDQPESPAVLSAMAQQLADKDREIRRLRAITDHCPGCKALVSVLGVGPMPPLPTDEELRADEPDDETEQLRAVLIRAQRQLLDEQPMGALATITDFMRAVPEPLPVVSFPTDWGALTREELIESCKELAAEVDRLRGPMPVDIAEHAITCPHHPYQEKAKSMDCTCGLAVKSNPPPRQDKSWTLIQCDKHGRIYAEWAGCSMCNAERTG